MKISQLWEYGIRDKDKETELRFKLNSIKSMSLFLYDARDTFFDFPDFVRYMDSLWQERQSIIEKLEELPPEAQAPSEDRDRIIECEDQLSTAFELFEIAYRQRLAGSYSELLTSARLEVSFPGSLTSMIKAADYVCWKTIDILGGNWKGFVVFSVVRAVESVSSAIVVFRHSYFRKADFFHDWLVSGHEIGHLLYWNTKKLLSKGPSGVIRYETLISDLLSDAFSHEHAYLGDSEGFLEDIIFSYSFSLPVKFRGYNDLRYFIYRLLSAWIFVEVRRGGKIYEGLNKLLVTLNEQFDPSDYMAMAIEILRFLEFATKNLTISTIPQSVIQNDIVIFLQEDLKDRYYLKRTVESLYYLLWTVNKICEVSFLGKSGFKELNIPPKPPYNLQDYLKMANRVIDGEIIENVIEDPFVFIKTIRDVCRKKDIDLDSDLSSKIRAAVVFSLCNSYTLTTALRKEKNKA